MAKGMLIAAMNIANAAEDEFHDWYDTEHLPERQRVPGFLVCQRWIGADDRKISIATYDLDNVAVLQSPGYLAIGGANLSPWSKRVTSRVERLMRFEGDQILPGDRLPPDNAGGFLINAMNVDPAAEAEFNEWYDNGAHPGARRGSGRPRRAPLPRDGRQPPLCRALPPGLARRAGDAGLEERGRQRMDAPHAPLFPRSPASRVQEIRARRVTADFPLPHDDRAWKSSLAPTAERAGVRGRRLGLVEAPSPVAPAQ